MLVESEKKAKKRISTTPKKREKNTIIIPKMATTLSGAPSPSVVPPPPARPQASLESSLAVMSAVPSTLPSTVHELVPASASPDRRLSISEAFSRRGPGNAQSLSFDLGSTRELQTLFATMFEGAMKAAAASQQPVLQALTTQMAQQGAANATLMRELKESREAFAATINKMQETVVHSLTVIEAQSQQLSAASERAHQAATTNSEQQHARTLDLLRLSTGQFAPTASGTPGTPGNR